MLLQLIVVNLLCFFSTISSSDATTEQSLASTLNAECKKCDDQFILSITEYQQSYGQWSSSMEAARYYCGSFDRVKQCYVDCVGGRVTTYQSITKRQFDVFYAESCDPVCYATVIPWCYMKHVGQYRLDQSCDSSINSLKSNLRLCLVEELFYKQNCNGSCTPGQRRANFVFMQLVSSCLIPSNGHDDCFNWIQYCIGRYYGASGDDYALQTDDDLRQNNSLSCDFYRDKFVSCMQQSVNSRVTLGEEPSLTEYDKPCYHYQDNIDYLEDLTGERLTKAVCKSPGFSLRDICDAAGSAVEPTTRSTAAFSASSSTAVAGKSSDARQLQLTPVGAASPTQAPNIGGTTESNLLNAVQSFASQPATKAGHSNLSPTEDEDIITRVYSQPTGAATVVAKTTVSTSVLTSDTMRRVSLPEPTTTNRYLFLSYFDLPPKKAAPTPNGPPTTRRNLLLDFFNLPPTTPSRITTGQPRVTLGIAGIDSSNMLFHSPATEAGAPRSTSVISTGPATIRRNLVSDFFNLPPTTPARTTIGQSQVTLDSNGIGRSNTLFESTSTTPGAPLSTAASDGHLQDHTKKLTGAGDVATTSSYFKWSYELSIGIFKNSSTALAAAPLSLLSGLLLHIVLTQRFEGAPL